MGSSASFSSQRLLSTHSVAGLNIFFMISVLHFYSEKKKPVSCILYKIMHSLFMLDMTS